MHLAGNELYRRGRISNGTEGRVLTRQRRGVLRQTRRRRTMMTGATLS